jgi:choline kinase
MRTPYLTLVTLIAVVLAAGCGTRLRPLTNTVPKCLLEVAGRTLLDRLCDAFVTAGLVRAVIVTGHLAERVETHVRTRRAPLDITCVRNRRYETTNNAASLAAAREQVGDAGLVVCDADVVFSTNPLPSLIGHPADCALAVDTTVAWDAEAMKVGLRGGGTVRAISKALSAEHSGGESIGIQKVGATAAPLLWEMIARSDPATAYYEDAFQEMIDRGIEFGVVPVAAGSWMEIDDAVDLAAARERFDR